MPNREVTTSPIAVPPSARPRAGRWPKLQALLLLGVLAVAVRMLPLERLFLATVGYVQGAGIRGTLLFWAVHVFSATILLPDSPFILAAGYLYGPVWGSASALTSNTLAALAAFWIARSVARDWFAARIARHASFAAIEEAVAQEPLKVVTLLRLSPLMPFGLLNYSLSLTRLSLRDYTLSVVIGSVPGALLFCYLGSLATLGTQLLDGSAGTGNAATALYWGGLGASVLASVLVGGMARRALARRLADGTPAPEGIVGGAANEEHRGGNLPIRV